MMKLIEVDVHTYMGSGREYHHGEILFDCGLKVRGIHFSLKGGVLRVNYPVVQDRKKSFHPSFLLADAEEDKAVKRILEYAWRLVKSGEKKEVYGYRKPDCSGEPGGLSGEDFEWSDEKREHEYSFSGMERASLGVNLTGGKDKGGAFGCAYARVYFDGLFMIGNIKIFSDREGAMTVQLPRHMQEEAVAFLVEGDRERIESCIMEQLRVRAEQEGGGEKTETLSDEDRLFRILWNASDNGYILQSKIRDILDRNWIDWKNTYRVSRISELVKKMDFLSPKRLEASPEHFVDWVAISYEKEPEPVVVARETAQILSDELKKELYDILAEEYHTNGKIVLSGVIPYLSKEHPDILEKFPKIKLKRILQSCEFVRFEGGPMPPIYIHIQDGASGPDSKEEDVLPAPREEEDVGCAPGENEQSFSGSEEQSESLEPAGLSAKKIMEYNHPAKRNPFIFVPNTKLISEQNIPDSKLPKISANESRRRFLSMASLGQLDSMDLELLYWISTLQYSKSTFLYDLIIGGFIEVPAGKSIDKDKLSTRLMRLYKVNLVGFYKLCTVDEDGTIVNKAEHRILMITAYGRTQLRMIGRQSDFDFFMALDNVEKILNRLSVNQWFTKFITISGDVSYYLDGIVTAKIAEANAARIPLIIARNGVAVFVKAFKRGSLFEQDIRSGEFAFWIRRVGNLLENYGELYIREHQVSFRKKPKLIFICEDSEQCREIYERLLEAVAQIGNRTILDSLWFAEDIEVYNQFLHAHFSFDREGEKVPERIDEFLGVECSERMEEEPELTVEQSSEEDMRILEELEREENLMLLSLEDTYIDGEEAEK